MDFLRFFLMVGSVSCGAIWFSLRQKTEADESGWRTRLTAEILAGRSAPSGTLAESGEARLAFYNACRGVPLEPLDGDESSSLLLRAALMARSVSFRKTKEAIATVKEVLDSFDSDEERLRDMASSASFRGSVMGVVLCFLVPFFVDFLPLLGVLQSGRFSLVPGDPMLREVGAALALVSSYYLSNVPLGMRDRRAWGMMAAFMAVLFVSTSLASSLPLVGSV